MNNKSTDLRRLPFSPDINPFSEPTVTVTQRTARHKTTAIHRQMMHAGTKEMIEAQSAIISHHKIDNETFSKIFIENVKASYDLSKTACRVFEKVFELHGRAERIGSKPDSISLAWFGGKLLGEELDISQKTFNRGLKELIEKRIFAPKMPHEYWLDPVLFSNRDRIIFLKEYCLSETQPAHC